MNTFFLCFTFAAGVTSVLSASIFTVTPEQPETGTWSAWGHWGECSATCGPGYSKKKRTCEKKATETNGISNILPFLLPQLTGSGGMSGILPFLLLSGGMPDTNTLLMLMLASQDNNSTSSSSSLTDILPILTLTDQQGSSGMDPLMLLLFSGAFGGNDTIDPFLLISLMNGMGGQSTTPLHCIGSAEKTMQCYKGNCGPITPVTCVPQWGPWGTCSATCGYAIMARQRAACNCPGGAHGLCPGRNQETRPCRYAPCATPTPVVVTCIPQWGPWSSCSVTCGYETMSRPRIACNCPGGAYGKCRGPSQESKSCGYAPCPTPPPAPCVAQWGPWGACSVSCGYGTMSRPRTGCNCPSGGYQSCEGPGQETKSCSYAACPTPPPAPCIPQWGPWGACSVSCGYGTMSRPRIACNCPSGRYGVCEGPQQETKSCSYAVCPTAGSTDWGPWGAYGECAWRSAENGCYKSRTRECHATRCTGPYEQSIECLSCASTAPETASCNVRDGDKRDCGVPGISYGDCTRKGCCFDDSRDNTVWCFYKA